MDQIKDCLTVVTWNINGIRSINIADLKKIFDSLNADIICLQETKVTKDVLDEATALIDGYHSFFSFSAVRNGYSGVATFCKTKAVPVRAEEGLTGHLVPKNCTDAVRSYGDTTQQISPEEKQSIDAEGRAVITQHSLQNGGLLTILNVYCPRVDPERPDRQDYKLQFYQHMYERAATVSRETGSHVLVVGDLNCSHRPIDHCDPGDLDEFCGNPSRQWLSSVLHGDLSEIEDILTSSQEDKFKFVDTFRHLHPTAREVFTCWNTKLGARNTNYGTRIDYILSDVLLAKETLECNILSEVFGSDHCPVQAKFNLPPCSTPVRPPSLCTKYFPEFSGVQQKLHAFLKPSCQLKFQPSTQEKKPPIKRKQQSIQDFFGSPKKKSIENVEKESLQRKEEKWEEWPSSDDSSSSSTSNSNSKKGSVNAWKALLKGPPQAPLCKQHNEKCVLRTVKKQGENFNRQFFCCARSEGHKSNPEARCEFFQWVPK